MVSKRKTFAFDDGWRTNDDDPIAVARSYRGQLLAARNRCAICGQTRNYNVGHDRSYSNHAFKSAMSDAEYKALLASVPRLAKARAEQYVRDQRNFAIQRRRRETMQRTRERKEHEERERLEGYGLIFKIERRGWGPGEISRTKRGFYLRGVPEQMTIAQAQEIARFIQRAAKVNLA